MWRQGGESLGQSKSPDFGRGFFIPIEFDVFARTADKGSTTRRPIQYIRHASDHFPGVTQMIMHKSRGFSLQASPSAGLSCFRPHAFDCFLAPWRIATGM